MKICDDLRQAVLQAAIQGKLTRQLPEDGDARDLLAEIAKEKARLIKEKKIKKEKPLATIKEDEEPFDVPDNWVWARLQSILDVRDGTHDSPKYVEKGIPFVTSKNLVNGKIDISNVKYISQEDADKFNQRSLVENNDIIMAMIGSIGKPIKVEKTFDFAIKNVALLKYIKATNISMDYILIMLYYAQENMKQQAAGGVQKFVSLNYLREYVTPLPPPAEQHRIVARVDKLMSEIDELEKVENQLVALKNSFPGDMKAALLQSAMQGKLTTQRAEDGNAKDLLAAIAKEKAKLIKEKKIKKEKPLAPITEDEIPFDIPDNWQWVRLRDVCTKLVDGDHNPPKDVGRQTEYIMASSQNINHDSIVDLDKVRYLDLDTFEKENQRTYAQKGDIFFTSVGTLGRSCVYKGGLNICFQRSVSVLTTLIFPYYLKYVLDSPYYQDKVNREATGTAQKGFYLNQLSISLICVPPLAEQQRIVAKLDKLLPLCEALAEK